MIMTDTIVMIEMIGIVVMMMVIMICTLMVMVMIEVMMRLWVKNLVPSFSLVLLVMIPHD